MGGFQDLHKIGGISKIHVPLHWEAFNPHLGTNTHKSSLLVCESR